MARWFDCPECIGYCEEWICPCCGVSRCEMCGTEVRFEEAPDEIRSQLYKAGLWCEEIVVVLDEDGDRHCAPAFTCQEVYNKYIEWNAIRIGAVCDQITALLCDDTHEDKPLFTFGQYTIFEATDDEYEQLSCSSEYVVVQDKRPGAVMFEWKGQSYFLNEQGIAAIETACEKGERIGLALSKNGTVVAVVFVVGKKE